MECQQHRSASSLYHDTYFHRSNCPEESSCSELGRAMRVSETFPIGITSALPKLQLGFASQASTCRPYRD